MNGGGTEPFSTTLALAGKGAGNFVEPSLHNEPV
jgi:hypothetical protein